MNPMVPESDYLHMKAEVERLTAELANMAATNQAWATRLGQAEAREMKLPEMLIDRDADTFKHLRKHRRQMARLWRSQF